MDMTDIQKTIEQDKLKLRTFGLTRIGIFGSFSRQEESDSSDIDLILDFDPEKKTYRNFYESTNYLETILDRSVDALTPQAISPYLKPYIEKDISYVQIAD